MTKRDGSRLKCSFCGKTQDKVSRLIAGPGAYICNECGLVIDRDKNASINLGNYKLA